MDSAEEIFWQEELKHFLPQPQEALQEALEYVCCPICYVLAKLPFEYFRLLPARWPEEPKLRHIVCAAGGFCNAHSWRFNAMQSHVAIGRVYVDILATLAEQPDRPVSACPVCVLENLAVEILLQLLKEKLAVETERKRYKELLGLCYPHWRRLWQQELAPDLRRFLLETQKTQTERLRIHLQGFMDKATVELKWTRTRDETYAPRRALLKSAGNEGI